MSSGQKATYEDDIDRQYQADLDRIKKLSPDVILASLVEFNQHWVNAKTDDIPLTTVQRNTLERARKAIAKLGIGTTRYY